MKKISTKSGKTHRSGKTGFLRTYRKALSPEAAAAGRREGADTVGFVFLQLLASSAEQTGRVMELMHAAAEVPIFLAVPNLTEALCADVPEGMMPDAAFMLAQISA